jgi:homoserine dehydrogenase
VSALSYLPGQMRQRRVTPMDELCGPYYFRCTVRDQSGVLAVIAGILAKHEISIESVIQKGHRDSGSVPLVVVTHSARESAIRAALDEIGRLDCVTGPVVKIRILEEE